MKKLIDMILLRWAVCVMSRSEVELTTQWALGHFMNVRSC